MHEMAITQSVVDMVVERTAGRRVTCVRLEVGRLSGVVADALRFCFDLATADTSLEGAELAIDETVGRATCRTCGDEFEVNDLILLCPCGSADVHILTGRELRVASVEMEERPCA
ncbi:MAG: [NiFe] hydrogenase nickel incorporation protein HypA [uncultured Nocardioidaceae bacterium]|uniref:Hydrogenase maturation factor HypA n=1 Tax=uncultured Nocardioidaceae bacterium TaxID=253824 RepID=A0A6J4N5P5_9ACTN|nr:MAG: [NiFe] hydrogenase nickel incorporation protein HypA [uncultured Nocardioidaceae bacterium]